MWTVFYYIKEYQYIGVISFHYWNFMTCPEFNYLTGIPILESHYVRLPEFCYITEILLYFLNSITLSEFCYATGIPLHCQNPIPFHYWHSLHEQNCIPVTLLHYQISVILLVFCYVIRMLSLEFHYTTESHYIMQYSYCTNNLLLQNSSTGISLCFISVVLLFYISWIQLSYIAKLFH